MNTHKHLRIKNKFKFIRSSLISIFLIIFMIFLFNHFSEKSQNPGDDLIQTSADISSESEVKEDTTIKISVVGDIMCHNTQYKDAYDSSTKKYDFSYVFSEIEP